MIQDVKKYFASLNRESEIIEFSQSSATVTLAAEALGVPPRRIAKTLSLKDGEGALLLVVAGDARIDNKKFKARFSQKARMLSAEDTLLQTGHPVGGVCPFALKNPLPVYLDESLRRFETVFPAAGSKSSAIELTLQDLEALSCGVWVDVCTLALP